MKSLCILFLTFISFSIHAETITTVQLPEEGSYIITLTADAYCTPTELSLAKNHTTGYFSKIEAEVKVMTDDVGRATVCIDGKHKAKGLIETSRAAMVTIVTAQGDSNLFNENLQIKVEKLKSTSIVK